MPATRLDLLSKLIATITCALMCAAAQAQTYDPVADFSVKSNPNGVWSYGTLSAVTGGTFSSFSIHR